MLAEIVKEYSYDDMGFCFYINRRIWLKDECIYEVLS